MTLIRRPIVIEKLEWSWLDGWSCSWRPLREGERGVPAGGAVVACGGIRKMLKWIDYMNTPASPTGENSSKITTTI